MRPWASWTAKAAVLSLTAGFAAAASGLPGVALAASGNTGSGQVASQATNASDVCSDAGALLGIIGVACQSVPLVGAPAPAPVQSGQSTAGRGRTGASQGSGRGSGQGSGQGSSSGTGRGAGTGSAPGTAQGAPQSLGATVGQVVQRAVAPLTAVLGAGGSAPALTTVPALAPVTAGNGTSPAGQAGTGGASGPGTGRTAPQTPANHAGTTNVPAATQLAGLGALPGLADLPSAGPASTPARNGASGGGIPMPGTALSAASSGVSSDSFAALAVGALLAGASALKIASRRTRDRKAGIGVVL